MLDNRPSTPNAPVTLSDADFSSFIRANRVAVIDFWATWCTPCIRIAPILDDLARENAGRVAIGKIDVDRYPALAMAHQVTGMPTLLVFRDGKLVDRIVGALGREPLRARILQHVA